jgi:hypothetical protein
MPLTSEIYPSIFHYTSESGLYGILSSNLLWATHFSYLNDAQELQNARAFLRPAFKAKVKEFLEKAVAEKRIEIAEGHSPDSLADMDQDTYVRTLYGVALKLSTPFIASFCAHPDGSREARNGLLSQWRGYGRGGGFAIEFDTKQLEQRMAHEATTVTHSGYHLASVVYSDEADKDPEISTDLDAIMPMVDDLLQALFGLKEGKPKVEYSYAPFIRCITRIKDAGFAEEREVRCVHMRILDVPMGQAAPKEIKFRAGARSQTPYIELFTASTSLPIKRIIVGPHPYSALRLAALELFLKQRHLGIEVSISSIPYLPD